MTVKTFNIEEIIGHVVEAEFTTSGYFGDVKNVEKGRIIYSLYNESLFFIPSGKRNRGYNLKEENIHHVELIRKDKSKHDEYLTIYKQKDQLVQEQQERKRLAYEQQEQIRQERYERERQKEKEKKEKEINEAKSLGGYEQLESEVISFYRSFEDSSFNLNFVTTIVVPLLNKLVNKGIPNVDSYPKYYFSKKDNPRMCALIESKLNIKLPATQKGSVEKINSFLVN